MSNISLKKVINIGLIVRGMSTSELADKIGMAPVTVSVWKRLYWEQLSEHHQQLLLKGLDATEKDVMRWSNVK